MTTPVSKPSRSLLKSIAESVDAPASLLRVLPELFADLRSLGSDPKVVSGLLRQGGCGPAWTVLDLACGKGAVAVAAAEEFKCNVVGVDAFEPFIRSARAWARERGVAGRTAWHVADVRRFASSGKYDGSLMIGLLGFEEAAPLLRRHTRGGGIYIIDDAVLARRDRRLGWPSRTDARELFKKLRDELIEEHVPSIAELRSINGQIESALMLRASLLAEGDPKLRPRLEEFVERQVEAGKLLETRLRPVLWLVRRGDEAKKSSRKSPGLRR